MAQKKIFSTSIDVKRLKALKHLAVDTDKSLGNLLEEAIKDTRKKRAISQGTRDFSDHATLCLPES